MTASPARRSSILFPVMTASLVVGLIALPASAQGGRGGGGGSDSSKSTKVEPPTSDLKPEEGGDLMPLAWSFLLLALVIGVNLIPVKRGHQD